MLTQIPVYVINLKEREERLKHIKSQFKDKTEFQLIVIEAVKHSIGSVGLWQTLQNIFGLEEVSKQEYIIICEDDHEFTQNYNKEELFECIKVAMEFQADILSGGPSWVSSIAPVNEKIYWMESFTGLQFTVVFQKFFTSIAHAGFTEGDIADMRIGALTDKKFFTYPFISIQREFGYSDATPMNNIDGRVEKLFNDCTERIKLSKQVRNFYKEHAFPIDTGVDIEKVSISTYIINLPERKERREHVEKQFAGKAEFDLTFIEAYRHEIGAVGLWLSIRKVIQLAIENDDDVIIICEDDHEFTTDYSKDILINTIIEASQQGVDYISGGCGGFGSAIPITKNRFWVSSMLSTQFIIVYKSLFRKILDEPFDNEVKADLLLSELTPNKMLIFPFISGQKDFGYSDVTPIHNSISGLVTNLFENTRKRLFNIQRSCPG
jgi:GR25 family glycosyltransferase involved in LPS biosynthesis